MRRINLEKAPLIPRLPDRFRPEQGGRIPKDLTGAKILRIGTVDKETADEASLEGGGLVIDYARESESEARRLVLAFNELAMWVAYRGRISGATELLPSQGGSPR